MPVTTLKIMGVGMVRRWEGVVTGAELVASCLEFADSAWIGALQYVIVDYRQVTAFPATSAEVRGLANQLSTVPIALRVAVIAPSDVVFGMARMFDMSAGETRSWSVHIVRTPAEAIEWLVGELPHVDFSEARSHLGRP